MLLNTKPVLNFYLSHRLLPFMARPAKLPHTYICNCIHLIKLFKFFLLLIISSIPSYKNVFSLCMNVNCNQSLSTKYHRMYICFCIDSDENRSSSWRDS